MNDARVREYLVKWAKRFRMDATLCDTKEGKWAHELAARALENEVAWSAGDTEKTHAHSEWCYEEGCKWL